GMAAPPPVPGVEFDQPAVVLPENGGAAADRPKNTALFEDERRSASVGQGDREPEPVVLARAVGEAERGDASGMRDPGLAFGRVHAPHRFHFGAPAHAQGDLAQLARDWRTPEALRPPRPGGSRRRPGLLRLAVSDEP